MGDCVSNRDRDVVKKSKKADWNASIMVFWKCMNMGNDEGWPVGN